jgi:hypothetical protein
VIRGVVMLICMCRCEACLFGAQQTNSSDHCCTQPLMREPYLPRPAAGVDEELERSSLTTQTSSGSRRLVLQGEFCSGGPLRELSPCVLPVVCGMLLVLFPLCSVSSSLQNHPGQNRWGGIWWSLHNPFGTFDV